MGFDASRLQSTQIYGCVIAGAGVCEVCKQEAYVLDPTIVLDVKDEAAPPPEFVAVQITQRPGGAARKRIILSMFLCAGAERRRC